MFVRRFCGAERVDFVCFLLGSGVLSSRVTVHGQSGGFSSFKVPRPLVCRTYARRLFVTVHLLIRKLLMTPNGHIYAALCKKHKGLFGLGFCVVTQIPPNSVQIKTREVRFYPCNPRGIRLSRLSGQHPLKTQDNQHIFSSTSTTRLFRVD